MDASKMAAILLTMLVLAYPLSIGPVSRWKLGHRYKNYRPLPPAVEILYRPMGWLCKVPSVARVANAYIDLWLSKDTTENYFKGQ